MRAMSQPWALGLFLCLGIVCSFLTFGCGGSSSPTPGITVADAGGTWFGPMGTTTSMGAPLPPTATGTIKIKIHPSGTIEGFYLDGIQQPAVGQVTGVLSETYRVFSVMLNGARGIIMQSAQGSHALYFDEAFQFAALQRDGTPPAVAYDDTDIKGTGWSGAATRVSSLMAPQVLEALGGANIDGGGMFLYTAGGSMNTGGPLSLVPGSSNGQFTGPFAVTLPPGAGTMLCLLTPDKAFLATWAGWGPTIQDVEIAAWRKH